MMSPCHRRRLLMTVGLHFPSPVPLLPISSPYFLPGPPSLSLISFLPPTFCPRLQLFRHAVEITILNYLLNEAFVYMFIIISITN